MTQNSSPVIILDGGLSRELVRLRAPFRQPEWTALALIEAPQAVTQAHRDFADAGASVLTTNSYALVPFHIGEQRFWEHAEELAARAGRLAREVADEFNNINNHDKQNQYRLQDSGTRPGPGPALGSGSGSGLGSRPDRGKVLVAGSLPPIFGSYEPALYDLSRVQLYLEVLVRALTPYVDFWLGETLSLIAEGEAVKEAVKHTGKPLWTSFTLDNDRRRRKPRGMSFDNSLSHGNGGNENNTSTAAAAAAAATAIATSSVPDAPPLEAHADQASITIDISPAPRLRSGETVTEVANWALESGVESLLFNCSPPERMTAAIKESRLAFEKHGRSIPLGVYANAMQHDGDQTPPANGLVIPLRPELDTQVYAGFAREWIQEGATIIGGCCGIGRDYIRVLASELEN